MKHSLEHLSARKQRHLDVIVKMIRAAVDAEMIILYGSHARGDWVEDVKHSPICNQLSKPERLLLRAPLPAQLLLSGNPGMVGQILRDEHQDTHLSFVDLEHAQASLSPDRAARDC